MRKLSKAEAGALGIAKARATIESKKQDRIKQYNLIPNHCLNCGSILDYANRTKKFCNHSCAASFNNKNRVALVEWTCVGCGKSHQSLPYKIKKYCTHHCQHIKTRQDSLNRLSKGLVTDRGVIRAILKREFKDQCFECGLSEWRGQSLSLEVDHIDGNAGNNQIENLRLLCPNCHSITNTWKGRNKGNGRAARGLNLY